MRSVSQQSKLYIVKDYQRIKHDKNSRLSLNWNLNREVAKLNYHIHTDAIKENLIPPDLTPEQISYKYANEADLLNVALFGKTAKQWRSDKCRHLLRSVQGICRCCLVASLIRSENDQEDTVMLELVKNFS